MPHLLASSPTRMPAPRLQGPASEWAPLLRTLPQETLSPLLWSDEELQELLQVGGVSCVDLRMKITELEVENHQCCG